MIKSLLVLLTGLFFSILHAQEEGLHWKVYHPKTTDTSYLFGTIHTQAEDIFVFKKKVLENLQKCSTIYLELDPFQETNQYLSAEHFKSKNKKGIRRTLGEDRWKLCDSLFQAQTGLPLTLFDTYLPIYLSLMINQIHLAKRNPDRQSEVMDIYIARQAKALKKKLCGLEQAEEQFSALRKIPFNEQIRMLEEELHHPSSDDIEKLTHYYKTEKTDSMLQLHLNNGHSSRADKFLRIKRNIKMSKTITSSCSNASTFVAVGALHLPGKDGIIRLLQKKGFVVQRIPLAKYISD